MALVEPLVRRVGRLARTTTFRIVALNAALFLTLAAMIAATLVSRTASLTSERALQALAVERDQIVQVTVSQGLAAATARVAALSRPGAVGLYYLADAAGERLAGNLTRWPPELVAGSRGGLFRVASGGILASEERLAAGLAVALPGGARLAVARDIEDQRQDADALRRAFLWALGVLTAAALASSLAASRMMLRRIETVNATSRSIMAGDLTQRIALAGTGDEMDDLAGSLNAMLERIEQLMAGLREVSDNIAHDLKTPLTRLRARAEAALRDPRGGEAWRAGLERTLEEADELIRTFNAMLLIARLDAGAAEQSLTEFDLADMVAGLAELYEPVAEEAGLGLTVSAEGPLSIRANRALISQALANLVDNAIKYSARGDRPEVPDPARAVTIRLARAESGATLEIGDRGPGIPPADRDRALRRFVRLEASRSRPGTGLGLSLVAAVVRMHGGRIGLDDNAPGLKVTVWLPVPQPGTTGPEVVPFGPASGEVIRVGREQDGRDAG